MPPLLRRLVVLFLLAAAPAYAADLPGPWVEFTSDGGVDVRAITAPGMSCPNVVADGTTVPTTTRGQPDPANGPYPLQVCIAHTTTPPRKITVEGIPVPTLHDHIRQIVVIGDTGCRLKDNFVQDCNDPVKWPFATVARLAAAHHPDLVIHVGDYHYRETPCPADHPGCAGSPYGDNWAVWQRDFFNPAAPLLAAAPWVLVRGNHELCDRGGHGWFRLLDPHPDTVDCTATTEPYTLRIDGLTLLMFDSADANDDKAPPEKVAHLSSPVSVAAGRGPAARLAADPPADLGAGARARRAARRHRERHRAGRHQRLGSTDARHDRCPAISMISPATSSVPRARRSSWWGRAVTSTTRSRSRSAPAFRSMA